VKVILGQGVGLGNDRNQVDTSTETLHDFNVKRLECVACGTDEVQAGVHTQIRFLAPLWLLLLPHICFVLVIDEFNNRRPGVAVVDIVAESGRVDDGKLNLELFFLKLGLDDFNLGQFVKLFVVTSVVVFRR